MTSEKNPATTNSAVLTKPAPVEFPASSPSATLKQRVGLTDIQIEYSRPGVKGRDIFGGLVPFGKTWRTGANAATKLTFSTAVKLNGTEIPAGIYALLTIPGKDEWTIIINKGAEQWGAYKYDEKNDVARIKVKPVTLDHSVANFTIEFNNFTDESADLKLVWDKTLVPIKLEVDFHDKLVKQIEEVMASNEEQKPNFWAAQYYFNHNVDLKKASQWADAAIAERDMFFTHYLKAVILAKLGDKEGAKAASKRSTELSEKANEAGYLKLNADLMSTLK